MPALQRFLIPTLLAGALAAAAILLSSAGFRTRPAAAAESPALPPEPGPVGVAAAADTAVFAGGCLWGVEAVFEHLRGVSTAISGFSGGSAGSPSYEQVSTGATGHAEAVLVVYDRSRISYDQLLQVFFTVAHDPTQLNRQGPDVGTQYRSAVFYRNAAQRAAAERYIAKVGDAGLYPAPVVTQVLALDAFHPADAYHQDYLVRHPTQRYIVVNDAPKLEELKRRFPGLYRGPG